MVIKRAERQAREEAGKKSGEGGGASGGSDGKGDGKGSDRHGSSGRRSKHAGRMSSRRKKYRRNELQQMQQQEVRGILWGQNQEVSDAPCTCCVVRVPFIIAHRYLEWLRLSARLSSAMVPGVPELCSFWQPCLRHYLRFGCCQIRGK